jgi:hypothetical protein
MGIKKDGYSPIIEIKVKIVENYNLISVIRIKSFVHNRDILFVFFISVPSQLNSALTYRLVVKPRCSTPRPLQSYLNAHRYSYVLSPYSLVIHDSATALD